MASLDQSVKDTNWNHLPVVVQALAQSAEGRTQPLLEGGRGFATSTAPKDGLFYLGQAQGEAEFAKFCAGLNLSRQGSSLPLRSMLPELQALQEKTNAAFQPPRSIDLHSRFIALNSTIKLADELDASRSYAGSLYQYLEAVRHYGMLSVAPLDAPQANRADKIPSPPCTRNSTPRNRTTRSRNFSYNAQRHKLRILMDPCPAPTNGGAHG